MALQDKRLFLLDMDGTIYLSEQLFDGTIDFLNYVKRIGGRYLFLTNNSSHNAAFYVERLHRMGLDVPRSKILTSGEATCEVISEKYPAKRAYVLGNEYLIEEFHEAGIPVDDANPEIAVIGFDTTLTYEKMRKICDLVRAGLPYIATHPDFNCPTENGFMPDIGAIIAFIEASTGRRPDLIVGKPNTGIVEAAVRRTHIAPAQMAMVGDRLYTDIETGIRSGMLSVLVMSGETTPDMLAAAERKPDLVFDRLADMNALLS